MYIKIILIVLLVLLGYVLYKMYTREGLATNDSYKTKHICESINYLKKLNQQNVIAFENIVNQVNDINDEAEKAIKELPPITDKDKSYY